MRIQGNPRAIQTLSSFTSLRFIQSLPRSAVAQGGL